MSLLNCQQFEHFQDHIPEPVSARPVPKLRPKSAAAAKAPIRPRPKTIHVDQGADVSASLQSSRGPRGSSSNLSGNLIDRCSHNNNNNNSNNNNSKWWHELTFVFLFLNIYLLFFYMRVFENNFIKFYFMFYQS